ncbi:MAG: FAD-dependent oxidoreductase [Sphingomicrobium sp.]
MSADFDIIIVGGGIAGASLGAELARARKVLILEAEDQCGFHSTGRSAAFYLESYGGADVARLTRASGPFLADPPAEFSNRGFLHRRGAVHLGQGEWPRVPHSVESWRIARSEIETLVPGLRAHWDHGLFEPGCSDIDVARLHAAYLATFRRAGGTLETRSPLVGAKRSSAGWTVELAGGGSVRGAILVNAAGAWADRVAERSGIELIGFEPKRRTLVQVRVGASGLKDIPLVDDWRGSFYFKGEADNSLWLSPHDETACEPCDVAPEEIDIAMAIERLEQAVDWPVERVERSWAGLRTFAPDRLPVYGFDVSEPAFFWCAGQGGFGIQTAPAAARMAAALITGEASDPMVAAIDPAIFSPARFA